MRWMGVDHAYDARRSRVRCDVFVCLCCRHSVDAILKLRYPSDQYRLNCQYHGVRRFTCGRIGKSAMSSNLRVMEGEGDVRETM